MSTKQPEKLVLIDGNAIVHRAFHALPPLSAPGGKIVNAVFGFSSILLKMIKELKPTYIIATFDLAGPTFRHEKYEEYKAKRVKAPQELYDQIPMVQRVLDAIGIPVFTKQGFEADDIIGTLAHKAKKEKDLCIYIATGDMDTLQLVDDTVFVFTLRKGFNDTIVYDKKAVEERYGLRPDQLVDYRGLKGDPSDNIPGVPGVGEKTASTLIKEYGSLENLYNNIDDVPGKLGEKLKENKDQAFFSKQLSEIITDVDVEFDLSRARWREHVDLEKLNTVFAEFGFKSLQKRLAEINVGKEQASLLDSVPQENEEETLENYFIAHGMKDVYETIEKPLIPVLKDMQRWGIKIDLPKIKQLKGSTQATLAELESRIHALAGNTFNINSPSQLATVLYDKLGIAGKIRKTSGGARSTAAPELEKIRDAHPIINLVLQYRELQKLLTTYIEPFPDLVAKDGRIHTTYDQIGAATGRLSSKDPNLQNIPIRTPLGQEFRKAFIAEDGFELVSCDYSQIDLRMVAHIAHDKKMIEAFTKGEDIHTRTASEIFKVSPEKVTKDMRRQAKVLNFGVLYGMGSLGVARAAEVSREQGKEFIDRYFAEFTGVANYIERTKEQARKQGWVATMFGRRRDVPEIQSTMPQVQAAGERIAVNMPVQGAAADLIKLAMIKIYDLLKGNDDARMLLQIHDELVFEIKKNLVASITPKLKDIMENVYHFDVPIVVDVKSGPNWQEMKKLEY